MLCYVMLCYDRPTRLLQFVAFVHLPFSFRSLDLFVASLLFRKKIALLDRGGGRKGSR